MLKSLPGLVVDLPELLERLGGFQLSEQLLVLPEQPGLGRLLELPAIE
ncbi:MAG: hypothetical protein ACK496_15355 [Acidobacteriota bacterium]